MKLKIYIFLGSLLLAFWGCSPDDRDNFEPIRPNIVFEDGASASAERNQSVDIVFTLRIGAAITSIKVNGVDATFDPNAEEQEVTFTYTVPDNAEVEQELSLPVEVVDELNRTLQREFLVSVLKTTVPFPAAVVDTDTKLDSSFNYLITERVSVTNNATLAIPSGTNVVFDTDTAANGGFLDMEIEAGARLVTTGTADRPVVFTSSAALAGQGEAGQWGRLVIEGAPGINSGSMRYTRIEYGGIDVANPGSPDDLNDVDCFRLNDVDANTTIEFVQVYKCLGGGIRAQGGNVNLRYCMATGNGSSGLYLRGGWQGMGQFLIVNHDEEDDHGDRDLHVRDADTNITLANMTFTGAGRDPDIEDASLDAARIRSDNITYQIYNSIFAEFAEDGIRAQNYDPGLDIISYCYIFQIAGVGDDGIIPIGETEGTTALRENAVVFAEQSFNNEIDADNTLIEGIDEESFVPDAKVEVAFDPSTLDPFFDPATYVGAIGDADWTVGWSLNPDGSLRE